MDTSPDLRKPWQRTRRVQALTILLGPFGLLAYMLAQRKKGRMAGKGSTNF